jgi:hypothetical protein
MLMCIVHCVFVLTQIYIVKVGILFFSPMTLLCLCGLFITCWFYHNLDGLQDEHNRVSYVPYVPMCLNRTGIQDESNRKSPAIGMFREGKSRLPERINYSVSL